MHERTLDEWLAWMEAHHPRQIELGLERVAAVAKNLTLDLSGASVITVGGTNGKGSTVAFLEAILRAQGYRVGAYTSPHLLRYNERVRIGGASVDDAQLCAAFAAVHAALGTISLTYFEFGTLAALWLFQRAALDVIILEVGLGGRLDAVNVIDADVAVLATVDLDHQDWLGTDREMIGREKAGIFRAGKPAICIDENPPQSVIDHAHAIGAVWFPLGTVFTVDTAFTIAGAKQYWHWSSIGLSRVAKYRDLPLPSLPLPSAAAALAALHCLPLTISDNAIRQGLASATLPGRFQIIERRGVEIILDVAHNPQAARWLAQRLAQLPSRRTSAVVAMMADKDIDAVIAALRENIDDWFVGDLPNNARALAATVLAEKLRAQGVHSIAVAATVRAAFIDARARAQVGERVVIFGSFFTVAAVLAELEEEEANGRG